MAAHTAPRPLSGDGQPLPQPTPPQNVSVRVERDNYGNIYAGNRFNTYVGTQIGDMITLVTEREIPLAEPLPRPVSKRLRDFPGLIGRTAEIRQVGAALPAGEPVEIHGEPGIGKTSLLRHLAWRLPEPGDGVLHFRAEKKPLEDLQHKLFAGFYTSKFPIKHYRDQLLEHLRPLEALIILDDLPYDRDDTGELLNALPRAHFVFAGEEQRLWGEGQSLALPGLSTDEGVALFGRSLGGPLTPDETELAADLVEARQGKPLAIIQAAAAVRQAGGDLSAVLVGNPSIAQEDVVVGRLVEGSPATERQALGVLALFPGTPMLAENVAGAAGVADAGSALDRLVDKGLAEQTVDGRYLLAAGLPSGALPVGLGPTRDALLNQYLAWSQSRAANPALVGQEAEALQALLEYAGTSGQHSAALQLARSLDAPLTLDGQWGTWDGVMDAALESARAGSLTAEEAWVLHQQGSRALVRLDAEASRPALEEALRLRSELGDQLGADLTEYHLDLWRFLFGPPVTPTPDGGDGGGSSGLGRVLWPVVGVALVAVAAVVALFLLGILPPGGGDGENGGVVVVQSPPPEPPLTSLTPRILSPEEGEVVPPGSEIWLEGDVAEIPIDTFPGRVSWWFADRRVGTQPEMSLTIPRNLESGTYTLVLLLEGDDGQAVETTLPLRVDREPELRLLRPDGAVEVAAGRTVNFAAEARDPEEGDISGDIFWESSIDGQFGQGAQAAFEPSPGRHAITLWVEDGAGNYVEDQVMVAVMDEETGNPPPELVILAPEDGVQVAPDETVEFRAAARDDPDGNLAQQIVWVFDDGARLNGPRVRHAFGPGRHEVAATVEDSDGQSAVATLTVFVEREPEERTTTRPEIELETVEILDSIDDGAIVLLVARAQDAEDGDISGDIVWWSSFVSGPLGQGPALEALLPPGEQVITAVVADNDGMEARQTRSLFVPEPEAPVTEPVIEFTSLEILESTIEGAFVFLEARARDAEDGDLSEFIVWRSSLLPGPLHQGPALQVELPPGEHIISAAVTDSDGLTSVVEEGLFIAEPPETEPDLVARLFQTDEAINEGNEAIFIPVRVVVENAGGQPAGQFKLAAEFQGPDGRFLTPLDGMPGVSGFYVFVDGLEAGGQLILDGYVRLDFIDNLYGETISVWVEVDSCAGEEFAEAFCSVLESDESNNFAGPISVRLPLRIIE